MSPLWPAGATSGRAGARASRIVSMTVGSDRLQPPSGAGLMALSSLPGGRITFRGRNSPWVTPPPGATRHL